MRTIINEFNAGMDNIYNSFFISFLSLKVLEDRPLKNEYLIPVPGFSHNRLEAVQINRLQSDSANEYVNSIRRHMLNDIVLCYERYATTMYASYNNGNKRIDPATQDDRNNKPSLFEGLPQLYSAEEKEFFIQLRRLRNSIVHYNGVYSVANPMNYTFYLDSYFSKGHEGEAISIQLDSILYIFERVRDMVRRIDKAFWGLFDIKD